MKESAESRMTPTGRLKQKEGGLGVLQVLGWESEVQFENEVKFKNSESHQCLPLLMSPNHLGLGPASLGVQIRNSISQLKNMDLISPGASLLPNTAVPASAAFSSLSLGLL